MRNVFGLLATASLALLGAHTASAANVNLLELGDTTYAQATQFEFGFTVTHKMVFGGEDDLSLTGQFFTNSEAGTSGNSIAGLIEPGLGGASEYVGTDWSVAANPDGGFNIATITINFASDPTFCEGRPFCGFLNNGPVEDGTLQDLTGYLSLPANIAVNVQSEIDAVPEPASIALIGAGILGVGIARRRR